MDEIKIYGEQKELRGKSLLGINDLSSEQIQLILQCADVLKRNRAWQRTNWQPFFGKTLAMIFEKPSLRTRVTFDVAMKELGGHAALLTNDGINMGQRESVKDIAQNLGRWVDGIMARTFAHQTVVDRASYSGVPVVNGLSDLEHPCQALADLQTIAEHRCQHPGNPDFMGLKMVFVGDGYNVANSLLLASAKVGMSITVACPRGYEPNAGIFQSAVRIGETSGATIAVSHDCRAAMDDTDIVYTDIWTSMGQEDQAEQRRLDFAGFQVNAELMTFAKPNAIVLHCLPAHREDEITSEILDGPQSKVLDQAENRLHAQKALLALTL